MRRILSILAATTALALAVPAAAEHHETPELTSALADQRRADDRARDEFRHPAETLHFFKVEPGMTVVDVVPGGGWYTRLLVPYLGPQGRYIAMNPDMTRSNNERMATAWSGLAGSFPEKLAGWGLTGDTVTALNADDMTDDMAGTADRVLIFREMHNLHRLELLHGTLTAARAMLKDDGMLGIVQHRAKAWAPGEYVDGSKGYMRQQDMIGMVEAHGFALVGTSEINANAMDTADHPQGVWEMPPSLGTKRDELRDLGESDRMTLLFRKR